ncbi:MAG TPA: hypothetical protein VER17_03545, partial [Tepidisphaeraceae bacterium]|nr:hypothetical protein [Tepidisphaeraceae bacterium]
DGPPGAAAAGRARGTLWIQDGQFVRPVRVRLGVSDGLVTEVIADDLKEGALAVTGEAQPGQGGVAEEARNPFAPQWRRGGGRR